MAHAEIQSPHEKIDSNFMTILILACLTSAGFLFARYWTLTPDAFNYDIYYTRIAINPYQGEGSPWGCRILTSLLVYWLPFSLPTGFKIVNLTALFLSGVVLVLICREVGMRGYLPFISVIPFLFSSGVEWQLKQIWFNDAVTYLFLSLTILAHLKKRDNWVCCFATIGVLNRSTALFFLPVWYIGRFGFRIDKNSLKQTVRTWGVPISLFFLLHSLWYPLTISVYKNSLAGDIQVQKFWEYYYWDLFRYSSSAFSLFQRLFSPHLLDTFFGSLLPLFLMGIIRQNNSYRHLAIFVLIVWLQFVFAIDIGRLETFAFPVVIPIALLYYQQKSSAFHFHGMQDFVFAILLFIFPHSIEFGLLLLISIFLFSFFQRQRKSISNTDIIRNIHSTDNSDRWRGNFFFFNRVPQIVIVVVFVWFLFFCLKTYALHPTPILSYPPSLLSDQRSHWILRLRHRSGKQVERFEINPDTTPKTHVMMIGNPSDFYDMIVLPLPNQISTKNKLMLYVWGKVEAGEILPVGTGIVQNQILTDANLAKVTIPAEPNTFFYRSVKLDIHTNDNCVLILSTGIFQGHLRFILFEATKYLSCFKME